MQPRTAVLRIRGTKTAWSLPEFARLFTVRARLYRGSPIAVILNRAPADFHVAIISCERLRGGALPNDVLAFRFVFRNELHWQRRRGVQAGRLMYTCCCYQTLLVVQEFCVVCELLQPWRRRRATQQAPPNAVVSPDRLAASVNAVCVLSHSGNRIRFQGAGVLEQLIEPAEVIQGFCSSQGYPRNVYTEGIEGVH